MQGESAIAFGILAGVGFTVFLIVMINRAVVALERIADAQDKLAGIDTDELRRLRAQERGRHDIWGKKPD